MALSQTDASGNAFAFTGTPVDKTVYGKGTFKTFGTADAGGYTHKYSISESIEDGTTLPLYYQLAPNEMLVPHEIMEMAPPAAVAGRAMMALPSSARAAPRMKSICPPTPE